MANHRVEDDQQLVHTGGEGEFFRFASCTDAQVEGPENGVPITSGPQANIQTSFSYIDAYKDFIMVHRSSSFPGPSLQYAGSDSPGNCSGSLDEVAMTTLCNGLEDPGANGLSQPDNGTDPCYYPGDPVQDTRGQPRCRSL